MLEHAALARAERDNTTGAGTMNRAAELPEDSDVVRLLPLYSSADEIYVTAARPSWLDAADPSIDWKWRPLGGARGLFAEGQEHWWDAMQYWQRAAVAALDEGSLPPPDLHVPRAACRPQMRSMGPWNTSGEREWDPHSRSQPP